MAPSASIFPYFMNAHAEESIPSWIRQNALWWGQGEISDAEFMNALEWLISHNFIDPSKKYNQKLNDELNKPGFFEDAKTAMQNVIFSIQKTPYADLAVRSLLPEIPVVGNLLLNVYDKSSGTTSEKNQAILTALENYDKLDEQRLKQEFQKLDDNKEEILKNREYLEQLVSDTSQILNELGIISTEIDELKLLVKTNNEVIIELRNEVKILTQNAGLAQKNDVTGARVTVSNELLVEIETKDNEIKELGKEIEELKEELRQLNVEVAVEVEVDVEYLLDVASVKYNAGENQEANKVYDEILQEEKLSDSDRVDVLYNKASTLYFDGVYKNMPENYDQALGYINQALAINPDDFWSIWMKGNILRAQQDYGGALKMFELMHSKEPGHIDAVRGIAFVLIEDGKSEEALPWIDRTLDLNPQGQDYFSLIQTKGNILRNIQDYDGALEMFEILYSIEPDNLDVVRGMALILLDAQRYAEALPWIDKTLDLNPENADYFEEWKQWIIDNGYS